MESTTKKPEMPPTSLHLPDAEALRPHQPPPGAENQAFAAADPPARILLIAQEGRVRAIYEAALRQTGVQVETVASIADFSGVVQEQAFSGIVIDIPTKIKALSDHKDLVSGILNRFPVIQVNLARDTQQIRALLYGRHERCGELADLVRETCLAHPARRLRTHPRQVVHLNLRLVTSLPWCSTRARRTVTGDLSEAGCFIVTSGRFQVGQTVWIQIRELCDQTPIACLIRHRRAWGEAPVLPGIGVSFETIRPAQVEALRQWL
jgi:hypothetical protein